MEERAEESRNGDPHRRQAAYLYGLVVSGAVLATAPDDFRLLRVAFVLFGTLVVYWAAETYAHWMAARSLLRRGLTREERRDIVKDGWPLVAASVVPLLVLAVEALLGIETKVALDITLVVNSAALVVLGWRGGVDAGLRGMPLVACAAISGLFGVAMIALKGMLH